MKKNIQDIENNLKQLSREIDEKGFSLGMKDKNLLRMNLEEYMAMKPLRGGGEGERVIFMEKYGRRIRENVFVFLRGTLAGVLGAVLIGVGAVYAASDALPGQALYPVKVNVNEEMMSLMATTPEEEARLQAELAQRRIKEVEKLVATGELSIAEQKDLRARFEKHTDASKKSMKEIKGKNKSAIVADIQSEFEAALSVHAELLARLAGREGDSAEGYEKLISSISQSKTQKMTEQNEIGLSDTVKTSEEEKATGSATVSDGSNVKETVLQEASTTRESQNQSESEKEGLSIQTEKENQATYLKTKGQVKLESIISWVREKENEISQNRLQTEVLIWNEISSKVRVLTNDAKEVALNEVQTASDSLDKNDKDINLIIRDDVVEYIGQANLSLKGGDEHYQAGEYSQAYEAYRDAMRQALKAQILIKTSKELGPYMDIKGFDEDELEFSVDEEQTSPESNSSTSTMESGGIDAKNTKEDLMGETTPSISGTSTTGEATSTVQKKGFTQDIQQTTGNNESSGIETELSL